MILCHGETLIDFLPTEARDGSTLYRPANGGSPGNVALTLARLDVPVGFVGGISTDFFGEALVEGFAVNGVSTAFVSRLDKPTMLAFVKLEGADARYAFFDTDSAARNWSLEAMPEVGPDVEALHFGSLSLIRTPAADAFLALMRREAGRRLISFDPNIRASLVDDEPAYRRRLEDFFGRAHVIKASEVDLDWIAPGKDHVEVAQSWLRNEARAVLLTRGEEGATLLTRDGTIARPALPVKVADTVGAGDSFMAGFLAALADRGALEPSRIGALSESELSGMLDFALAVAAVTVSRVGADPPRRADLQPFLASAVGRGRPA